MPKIVNFHLPADNVERAAQFYKDVFGWEFAAFPDSPVPYWTHEPHASGGEGPGVAAAITQRAEPVKAPVPTIEVDDIDAALTQVVMHGGRQARVQTIPGVGRFGYAMDSEDNVIALLQREKSNG
ncbi:MAG TPA: VOC family protein [Candidatus Baltobacteraceae bacterium]|nr:VOC family protein [Candidatus Baltobacteraceae bacterium]